MIDKVMQQLIAELGINGVLILGLYFTLGRYLIQLSTATKKMTEILAEINTTLKCPSNDNKK